MLQDASVTLRKLSKDLDISLKSLRLQMSKLEKLGIKISHIGPQKGGRWQIDLNQGWDT